MDRNEEIKEIIASMDREDRIKVLLDELAAVVYEEIAANKDGILRVRLSNYLGLRVPCYPKESPTQGSRTWLTGILIRRLQDAGKVEAFYNNGMRAYRVK